MATNVLLFFFGFSWEVSLHLHIGDFLSDYNIKLARQSQIVQSAIIDGSDTVVTQVLTPARFIPG